MQIKQLRYWVCYKVKDTIQNVDVYNSTQNQHFKLLTNLNKLTQVNSDLLL